MDLDDLDDLDAALPDSGRVSVWARPEQPGPMLDRRDLVNGHHRNLSYGWTWWSARHIVLLPEGMSFYDALASTGPVEVTIVADVDPLGSGLNDLHQRFEADWCTRKPETVVMSPEELLAEVETDSHDHFRLMRDIHRREHGLPRAVVRSDDYGRAPLYLLRHDWPDGTFTQGGKVTRDGHRKVFIEAFPRTPNTYLRGEGDTYADAEDSLWSRWQRIVNCPSPSGDHEWEARGYRNGAGFCRHCGLFGSHVFDLAAIGSVCAICGDGTYWTTVPQRNLDGQWVSGEEDLLCQQHSFPSYIDLLDQVEAHTRNPDQPMPDLSWMEHRLPAGVPVTEVSSLTFYEAWRHAVRDRLDLLLDEKDPTGT